jgi:hypothetical protein
VLVEVAGMASEVAALPDESEEAIKTEGRSVVEKLLGEDEPPRVVQCGTTGCFPV